jgi:murein DD-endopeptidase MepM/ murein hydrolase activator NlpD
VAKHQNLKALAAAFFLSTITACTTAPLETRLTESPFEKKQREIPEEATTQSDSGAELSWIWPLKDGKVTQGFRYKKGKRRGHRGIDIGAPKGTAVYAAHDGVVIYAGRRFSGYGKFIIVESDDGQWGSFYSHLFKMHVKQGKRVNQGQLIGEVGRTGRATGYHLHFEIRKDREPIDPLTILP